jgi:hypothetical protein
MSAKQISALLGRMAKDEALLKEFCASPAKVLKREGIEMPASEIPAKIDLAEFSKRLRGAVSAGAIDLSPYEVNAQAGKHIDIGHIDIDHFDTPIISIKAGPGPTNPESR